MMMYVVYEWPHSLTKHKEVMLEKCKIGHQDKALVRIYVEFTE